MKLVTVFAIISGKYIKIEMCMFKIKIHNLILSAVGGVCSDPLNKESWLI